MQEKGKMSKEEKNSMDDFDNQIAQEIKEEKQ